MEILFIALGYQIVVHKKASFLYSQSWFCFHYICCLLSLHTCTLYELYGIVGAFDHKYSFEGTSSSSLTLQRRSYRKKLMNFLILTTGKQILQTSNRYIIFQHLLLPIHIWFISCHIPSTPQQEKIDNWNAYWTEKVKCLLDFTFISFFFR